MTWKDFVEFEKNSDEKHEYLRGEVWAMAGGTPEHGRLAANAIGELRSSLKGRPCVVMSSDVRVRVRDTDRSTYPDTFVVCGKLITDPDDENTIVNPVVIVEVLSPGTEASDRGEKFAHYQHLESLKDDVLLSRRRRFVAHDVVWAGQKVPLPSLGIELDLDALCFNPLS